MFRAKVLIFMVPLVLPIGQPPARATDGSLEVIECAPVSPDAAPSAYPVSPVIFEPADGYSNLDLNPPDVE